jgi:hypothetical protein
VATDRAALRRLLQLCLPANLFSSLDIEALIDAMIKSTVVEAGVSNPDSNGIDAKKPPGVGDRAPPLAAGKAPPPGEPSKTASVKVTQKLPGVKASQVRGAK